VEAHQKHTVERLKQHLKDLPLLPAVVLQLLRLDVEADSYFDEVTRLVSTDPAFATKLIAYTNSAAVAPMRPTTRLRDAIIRIGARRAVNLVLAASATKVFLPRTAWERGIWSHSIETALVASGLAGVLPGRRLDPEELYLAGLLHDVGRFILYLEAPDDLRLVDETSWDTPQELVDAEKRICGFSHVELGYQAALKWKLPEQLAQVIRFHHTPRRDTPPDLADMIEIIRIADWVSVVLAKTPDWRALDAPALHGYLAGEVKWPGDVWTDPALAEIRRAMDKAAQLLPALGL
jgi:putative nucleotidyltransferase with HDIG domain